MVVALCYKKRALSAKKTIAIIASSAKKTIAVANKILLNNFRLLLLSKYPHQFMKLSKAIREGQIDSETELIHCVKDGCWEADIIMIDIPHDEEKEIAELIKEVATQKMVISFSENENDFKNEELFNLLKYAKVIKILSNSDANNISVFGKNKGAVLEALSIIKNIKTVNEIIYN